MEQGSTKSEQIKDWIRFALSYFDNAHLCCGVLIKREQSKEFKEMIERFSMVNIERLYIPIIYSVKHGIELALKVSSMILNTDEDGGVMTTHDLQKIVKTKLIPALKQAKTRKIIKEGLTEEFFVKKELIDGAVESILDHYSEIFAKVNKYYYCTFLSRIISEDYHVIDNNNTAFRYPDNIGIRLKYSEIIKRVTIDNIHEIVEDLDIITRSLSVILIYLKDIFIKDKQ